MVILPIMAYSYRCFCLVGKKSVMVGVKKYYRLLIHWGALGALALLAGCASVPETAPVAATRPQPPVVDYALSLQGKPYRYGKKSPEEGFDCSGFVQHVYERQGIALPRTVQEMARSPALTQVSKNELHAGDLLFFNINGKPFSHVGIYINGDNFIHAPSQSTGRVLVSSLKNRYWNNRFSCARRPYPG